LWQLDPFNPFAGQALGVGRVLFCLRAGYQPIALERQIALNTPHLAVTQVFYNTCVTVSKQEKWQSM